ncbi:hypothetical protein AC482_05645 [miscellaneous Crenarchaeota group-15 archaeon DG-45]|uniref:Uncharacterized protein n=1 Tax=miscellaneous Crenarchaeota group-15 archaeon DG-45 TaxID=1685127 RepID=A0A0M0BMH7_9ARCH|nr:MAG: hypothetical protein AC482_05645 [miscellaneous Crenarchaeota group-15 archaeon DG-45]
MAPAQSTIAEQEAAKVRNNAKLTLSASERERAVNTLAIPTDWSIELSCMIVPASSMAPAANAMIK